MQIRSFIALGLSGLLVTAAICFGEDTATPDKSKSELQQEVATLKAEVDRLQRELSRQSQRPAARRAYPNRYHAFTGAYSTTAEGVTKLPSSAVWEVVPSDGGGLDPDDPRVMMRLHDHRINFLSVTAQMDLPTAQRLHADLGKMILLRLRTHGGAR